MLFSKIFDFQTSDTHSKEISKFQVWVINDDFSINWKCFTSELTISIAMLLYEKMC